ncbi:hypothetical protein [Streptomyces sp. WG-D5]
MLIFVAMVLGGIGVVCIGITARRMVTGDVALGPPLLALATAFASAALLLTAMALGQ